MPISADVQALVDEWLQYDENAKDRAEIEAMVAADDGTELRKRMVKRIQFGTAGLRGRMQAGYSCMNDLIVRQTAQGLVHYLQSQFGADTVKTDGIVIGYDGRHRSQDFARISAAVFMTAGIPVYLFNRLVATPMVAFGVLHTKACAGIMVTASHNPKQDNGYKLYWRNGCQITEPHDAGIAASILANLKPVPYDADVVKATDAAVKQDEFAATPLHALLRDRTADVLDAYFVEIKNKMCFTPEDNARNAALPAAEQPIRLTYTAMHGVGHPFCVRAFETFGLPPYVPVEEQCTPDPEFSTVVFPNPEEGKGALALAIATAAKHESRVIIANDPDADRLAVAELDAETNEWYVFNGNEIGAFLADWTWKQYKKRNADADAGKCALVTTAVSSKFLSAYAKAEGLQFHETLTGFKWIGNKATSLRDDGVTPIFGYEEAIGFMILDTAFDKDGVRAAAVFAELALSVYAAGATLKSTLQGLYDKYGFFAIKTNYYFCYEPAVMTSIFDRLRTGGADGGYIRQVGEHKITRVRDQATGYDDGEPDKKTKLPVTPGAHMITYWFENGCVATLRGSGTEPKLKYYVEYSAKETRAVVDAFRQTMADAIVAHMLQPEANKLVAPKA